MVGWIFFFSFFFFCSFSGGGVRSDSQFTLGSWDGALCGVVSFLTRFLYLWMWEKSYYHGLLWSLLCLQGVLSCGLFLFFVKTLWVFILVASSICSTGALKIVVAENLTGDLIR